MWSIDAKVEDALWEAARAELPTGALDPRALTAAIVARSHRYTDERERLAAPLAPRERDADLAARALFFTVADAAKILVPLSELEGRGLLPSRLRVLDVGAGVGAMTLGLLSTFGDRVTSVAAVDRDDRALAIFRRAAAALRPGLRLDARTADAADVPPGPFDLILAGSVLNELPGTNRLPLVRALLARLDPAGAVILVEPALRETARSLHALRDAAIAGRAATVFAPCTRAGNCPALDEERDWCHEDRPFQPPPRLRDLIARTNLRSYGLKMSYLTLRHAGDPLVVAPAGRRALRVVSGPLDAKGIVERLVCGEEGRRRLRLLTRHKGDALRAVDASRRGDVLLEGDGELERIEPATSPSRSPSRSSPR